MHLLVPFAFYQDTINLVRRKKRSVFSCSLPVILLRCFTILMLSCITRQNELSAILRFGAEELFKEDKTDEETKRNLESLDIDEILERAEKVETKGGEGEEGNELLSAFKACDV